MSDLNDEILDNFEERSIGRRRDLIPTWIKVFSWIFMIATVLLIPGSLIATILGYEAPMSLYGISSPTATSSIGIFVIALFAMKGIVGYGLWFEEEWAPVVGTVDAVLGTVLSLFVSFVVPFIWPSNNIHIGLEPLLLIPYGLKMYRMIPQWRLRISRS